VSIESSKIISRKSTRAYKRRSWASAAVVFLVVSLADWLWDRPHLYMDLMLAGLLVALYLYFLRKNTRFHTFADEVLDCGDHLKITKGRMQLIVPFSTIARARFSPGMSLMSTVTLDFVQPTDMGKQIEFLTECKARTAFTEAETIAEDLSARAAQAREAGATSGG
jgi:hypothetical protein